MTVVADFDQNSFQTLRWDDEGVASPHQGRLALVEYKEGYRTAVAGESQMRDSRQAAKDAQYQGGSGENKDWDNKTAKDWDNQTNKDWDKDRDGMPGYGHHGRSGGYGHGYGGYSSRSEDMGQGYDSDAPSWDHDSGYGGGWHSGCGGCGGWHDDCGGCGSYHSEGRCYGDSKRYGSYDFDDDDYARTYAGGSYWFPDRTQFDAWYTTGEQPLNDKWSGYTAPAGKTAVMAESMVRGSEGMGEGSCLTPTETMSSWPAESQAAGRFALDKYGTPDTWSSDMFHWYDAGPWALMTVSAKAADHDWPVPHKDMFEQGVHFKVPDAKLSELAAFDGSIMVDKTKGLLIARCDKEENNILALNLAMDIINGEISAQEARTQLAAMVADYKASGQKPAYMTSLQFSPLTKNSAANRDKQDSLVSAGRGSNW
jgi:hypothetical protein